MSGIASIFFLIFSCLEAYYSTGGWANNCNDIGGDGIIHNGCRLIIEWAFASVKSGRGIFTDFFITQI